MGARRHGIGQPASYFAVGLVLAVEDVESRHRGREAGDRVGAAAPLGRVHLGSGNDLDTTGTPPLANDSPALPGRTPAPCCDPWPVGKWAASLPREDRAQRRGVNGGLHKVRGRVGESSFTSQEVYPGASNPERPGNRGRNIGRLCQIAGGFKEKSRGSVAALPGSGVHSREQIGAGAPRASPSCCAIEQHRRGPGGQSRVGPSCQARGPDYWSIRCR